MSLFRLRTGLILALVVSGAALSACGYRPLYGQASINPAIETDLSGISVAPMYGRSGQIMHLDLIRRLQPTGAARVNTHSLRVSLTESISKFAVEQDTSATRANLRLRAKYRLIRSADGREVLSGNLTSTTSYNILSSDYATLIAEKDARKNAINEMGEQLQLRMAIHFHKPPSSQNASGATK